jgi:predicted nucleotidyltransferase
MNIYNVKYCLNRDVFERLLKEKGYKNHTDFCKKSGLHKNTLQYYLSGRDVFSSRLYDIATALDVDPKNLIARAGLNIENVQEIEPIIKTLSAYGLAVVLLGSRAKGKSKKYSDWDIGITGGRDGLGGRKFIRLRSTVQDLAEDLPRKVDLVNLDSAPVWFLTSIDYDLVFLGGNKLAYNYFKGVLDGIKKYKTNKVA